MKNGERINGFDALRSIAMWLGVLLHSLIVYKATPATNWPHDKSTGYVFFDWLYDFIHIFRMPLFYFVAGFFSRLVILQKGTFYFVQQRFKRIFIPFVLSTIILLPVSLLPFHYYTFFYIQQRSAGEAFLLSFKHMLRWNGFAHLWFLYYLLFFYSIAIVLFFIIKKLKINVQQLLLKIFLQRSAFLPLIIVITILWLLLQSLRVFTPPVYTGIKPNVAYLLYYGLFFYWGWFMQINVRCIFLSKELSWLLFVAGLFLSVLIFTKAEMIKGSIMYLLASVETVSLIAGCIGLFLNYFATDRKSWRYFSDSSYWVYLIHLVIVATVQLLLFNSIVPPFLRMPVVLITTLILSLLSYHFFVRFTIIGTYLHGKREQK